MKRHVIPLAAALAVYLMVFAAAPVGAAPILPDSALALAVPSPEVDLVVIFDGAGLTAPACDHYFDFFALYSTSERAKIETAMATGHAMYTTNRFGFGARGAPAFYVEENIARVIEATARSGSYRIMIA